jgi:hypothetical protein
MSSVCLMPLQRCVGVCVSECVCVCVCVLRVRVGEAHITHTQVFRKKRLHSLALHTHHTHTTHTPHTPHTHTMCHIYTGVSEEESALASPTHTTHTPHRCFGRSGCTLLALHTHHTHTTQVFRKKRVHMLANLERMQPRIHDKLEVTSELAQVCVCVC